MIDKCCSIIFATITSIICDFIDYGHLCDLQRKILFLKKQKRNIPLLFCAIYITYTQYICVLQVFDTL